MHTSTNTCTNLRTNIKREVGTRIHLIMNAARSCPPCAVVGAPSVIASNVIKVCSRLAHHHHHHLALLLLGLPYSQMQLASSPFSTSHPLHKTPALLLSFAIQTTPTILSNSSSTRNESQATIPTTISNSNSKLSQ